MGMKRIARGLRFSSKIQLIQCGESSSVLRKRVMERSLHWTTGLMVVFIPEKGTKMSCKEESGEYRLHW